jgi:hypothetical protein
MRNLLFTRRFPRFAAATLLSTPSPTLVAPAVHPVLLDADANPATGCPVTAVKGVVRGVGQDLRRWALSGMAAVAVVIAPGATAAPCAGFTDVDSTSMFCVNVEWLKNRAITLGCTTTTYCPNDAVSRLTMAAFMNRLGTALTPAQLAVDFAPGAIDLDANLVVCQTQDFAVGGFPRRAYVDLSFSGNASADVGIGADLAMSTNGGASWTTLNTAPNRGVVAANQWAAFVDLGFADLAVGQNVRFGVRMSRGGLPGTSHLAASRCALRVLLYSRTGSASPL